MSAWRHTFRYPRFFFLDARVAFFILAFLLHIRLWTFIVLIAVMAAFYWVERYGFDFPSALRALRLRLAGNVRPPLTDEKARFPVDYDRRPLK